MSVVVKRLKSSSMEIYVKGAPEVMGDICDKDSCMSIIHSARLSLTDLQSRRIMTTSCRITLSGDIASLQLQERVSRACLG